MKLNNLTYYTNKLEVSLARLKEINYLLSSSSRVIRWKYNGDLLRSERDELSDNIKGYKVIIAHLESGIGLSRYQNYKHAVRIINEERREKANG